MSVESVLSTIANLLNRTPLICLPTHDAQLKSTMAVPKTEMEGLHLSEDTKDEEALPSRSVSRGKGSEKDPQDAPDHPPQESEDDREAALRSELQNVRDINQVVTGVLDSLNRAKGNMEVFGSCFHIWWWFRFLLTFS